VHRKPINIIGAGLCGSLLSIMLAKRGIAVKIYERQEDPRHGNVTGGRSINLAMSARGIHALRHAGVFAEIEPLLVPMRGRRVHKEDGSSELLPYGQKSDEQIYSVSRAALNRILIDNAERKHGVVIEFQQEAAVHDPDDASVVMRNVVDDSEYTILDKPVIAADGAGSAVRRAYGDSDIIAATESLLPHSYKELAIPADPDGGYQLATGALHIWPRGGFMLIALPNPGGDFTLTLFLPDEGENGFSRLKTDRDVVDFFETHFADVTTLIPDLPTMYARNPVGVLGTVRCKHWHDRDNFLLIGDAAHAVVPFHGQGMNLAFEDCVVLDRVIERSQTSWAETFAEFEQQQMANANAIADMALENYVEMRDTVRDPKFALRKAVSFELERRVPRRFIPRYSMVMFHAEIPYAVAQQRGEIQEKILTMLTDGVASLDQIDLAAAVRNVVQELDEL